MVFMRNGGPGRGWARKIGVSGRKLFFLWVRGQIRVFFVEFVEQVPGAGDIGRLVLFLKNGYRFLEVDHGLRPFF
jgi:hypothetical protein